MTKLMRKLSLLALTSLVSSGISIAAEESKSEQSNDQSSKTENAVVKTEKAIIKNKKDYPNFSFQTANMIRSLYKEQNMPDWSIYASVGTPINLKDQELNRISSGLFSLETNNIFPDFIDDENIKFNFRFTGSYHTSPLSFLDFTDIETITDADQKETESSEKSSDDKTTDADQKETESSEKSSDDKTTDADQKKTEDKSDSKLERPMATEAAKPSDKKPADKKPEAKVEKPADKKPEAKVEKPADKEEVKTTNPVKHLTKLEVEGIVSDHINQHLESDVTSILDKQLIPAVDKSLNEKLIPAVNQAVKEQLGPVVKEEVDPAVDKSLNEKLIPAVNQAVKEQLGTAVKEEVDPAVDKSLNEKLIPAVNQAVLETTNLFNKVLNDSVSELNSKINNIEESSKGFSKSLDQQSQDTQVNKEEINTLKKQLADFNEKLAEAKKDSAEAKEANEKLLKSIEDLSGKLVKSNEELEDLNKKQELTNEKLEKAKKSAEEAEDAKKNLEESISKTGKGKKSRKISSISAAAQLISTIDVSDNTTIEWSLFGGLGKVIDEKKNASRIKPTHVLLGGYVGTQLNDMFAEGLSVNVKGGVLGKIGIGENEHSAVMLGSLGAKYLLDINNHQIDIESSIFGGIDAIELSKSNISVPFRFEIGGLYHITDNVKFGVRLNVGKESSFGYNNNELEISFLPRLEINI